MKDDIARFVVQNKDLLRQIIQRCNAESASPSEIVEYGYVLDRNLELGPEFGQKLIWAGNTWSVQSYGGLPADTAWRGYALRFGLMHGHPDYPGMDGLSPFDLEVLRRLDCHLMMVVTSAGGQEQVIARWDIDEGSQEEARFAIEPE